MTVQKTLKRGLGVSGVAITAVLSVGSAQAAAPVISARVECSALSVQPETSPAIGYDISFTRGRKTLLASRTTDQPRGQENFYGIVESYGLVKMSGTGRTTDGSSSWTLTFTSSRIDGSGGAVLSGGLRDSSGNRRTCKMTIPSGLR